MCERMMAAVPDVDVAIREFLYRPMSPVEAEPTRGERILQSRRAIVASALLIAQSWIGLKLLDDRAREDERKFAFEQLSEGELFSVVKKMLLEEEGGEEMLVKILEDKGYMVRKGEGV